MNNNSQYIAIIPARGGGQGMPGKNMMMLAGKPLIGWTIEAALQSGIFRRVIVSTDSWEIAVVSAQFGAEVPFMRPEELAHHNTPLIDVLVHATGEIRKKGDTGWSHLACLQPSSPLRTADNIREAAALLEEKSADAVISVCRSEYSPLWSHELPANLSLNEFLPADFLTHADAKPADHYRLNRAIYFCRPEKMIEEHSLFLKEGAYLYVMSRKDSIDINDPMDFDLAALYLAQRESAQG